MEPFDSIQKLITEHGSAAILRERLGLAEQQYVALQRKLEETEAELATTRRENEVLRQRLSRLSVPEDYVSVSGVLWRRTASGFEAAPYCPTCKIVMFDFPPGEKMFWNCSRCKMTAPYSQPPSGA
jgi:hypothetical protein